ncbi:MAG: class I SAM-dependent methyltransferase [Candidatus Zixiibacteriota bacterium]
MRQYSSYQSNPILAELYDLLPMHINRRDVPFYVEVCRQANGPIVELGCGTGRVLIPVAEAGCSIFGVDSSESMLRRCRKKVGKLTTEQQERITLIEASMTAFSLPEQAALAIIPFRAFQHIVSMDDQMACLRAVHANLLPAGRLIFDLFQVDPARLQASRHKTEVEDTPEFDLPDGRKLRRTNRLTDLHMAEQCNDVELIYYLTDIEDRTERIVQSFPMRYFFRFEVEHLLARCGFAIDCIYGNFDRSELADNSPEMIFVARKA